MGARARKAERHERAGVGGEQRHDMLHRDRRVPGGQRYYRWTRRFFRVPNIQRAFAAIRDTQ
jgi:hypothetical protein